ncbi:hypothetical protein F4677DRAFT_438794 [Hypoxylon crocopeplum]|nr:hypothetical protein F4677DRAFT_438794 [Hypoxylon crocopeplum]
MIGSLGLTQERGELLYDYFEAAMLAISDSQLLLAAAQCINFGLTGKCTTSQYHYEIGKYLVMLACFSVLITMVLARNFCKAPLAAFIRLGSLIALVGMLGYMIQLPQQFSMTAETMPPTSRKDSLILLSASCFLDPDLSGDVFRGLNGSRLAAVGCANTNTWTADRILYYPLVAFTCAAVIFQIAQVIHNINHRHDDNKECFPGRPEQKPLRWLLLAYWVLPWVSALGTLPLFWTSTDGLKNWVAESGWLDLPGGHNAENIVQGFGQIAPIAAVVAVIIATCEQWTWP